MKLRLKGKKYPVRDQNGNIVGQKTIKDFFELENMAAVAIRLGRAKTLLIIPYNTACRIHYGTYDGNENL